MREGSRHARAGWVATSLESSATVRLVRPLWAGSLICTALTRVWRSLSGRDSWMGRVAARHPPSRNLDRATRVVAESAIVTSLATAMAWADDAWRSSSTRQFIVSQVITALQPWQRIRAAGVVVLAANAVHAALDAASVFSTPWRAAVPVLFVVIGLFLVGAARPLAVALEHWLGGASAGTGPRG